MRQEAGTREVQSLLGSGHLAELLPGHQYYFVYRCGALSDGAARALRDGAAAYFGIKLATIGVCGDPGEVRLFEVAKDE